MAKSNSISYYVNDEYSAASSLLDNNNLQFFCIQTDS